MPQAAAQTRDPPRRAQSRLARVTIALDPAFRKLAVQGAAMAAAVGKALTAVEDVMTTATFQAGGLAAGELVAQVEVAFSHSQSFANSFFCLVSHVAPLKVSFARSRTLRLWAGP